MEHIENFYTNYDEEARLENYRHGKVEFLTTMRYIEKYLYPGATILDIGAGTGRYSRKLADMGYTVEAVELVPHNIEVFKQQLSSSQNIRITQGNALDLSMFSDNSFDITLIFGPMYHLYTLEDKRQVIAEALRVTKTGGVLFVAYCISDASILEDAFANQWMMIQDYIEKGQVDPVTFDTISKPENVFELVRKEDIEQLMSAFNTKRLHYVATDMISRIIREGLANMDEATFDMYLKYHFAICERPDMVGMTHHSLDVVRKLG